MSPLYKLPNGNWISPEAVTQVVFLAKEPAHPSVEDIYLASRIRVDTVDYSQIIYYLEDADAMEARDRIATEINSLLKKEKTPRRRNGSSTWHTLPRSRSPTEW